MGFIKHHALIVTGSDYAQGRAVFEEAHRLATLLCKSVSPIGASVVNGHPSFAVFPDGSKEGWDTSEAGNKARDTLIDWMDQQRYSDGSGPLSWVEVEFGGDDDTATVTRHVGQRQHRSPGVLP